VHRRWKIRNAFVRLNMGLSHTYEYDIGYSYRASRREADTPGVSYGVTSTNNYQPNDRSFSFYLSTVEIVNSATLTSCACMRQPRVGVYAKRYYVTESTLKESSFVPGLRIGCQLFPEAFKI
jgi:hypothetical protein